jgi:hypothetical protein
VKKKGALGHPRVNPKVKGKYEMIEVSVIDGLSPMPFGDGYIRLLHKSVG